MGDFFLSNEHSDFTAFALDRRLLAAVTKAGYTKPTPIQQKAIPVVLEGYDVLGIAQTGTGKTAAFMLPIAHRLANGPRLMGARAPRCLILAPTRELADQIGQAGAQFGGAVGLQGVSVYGGVGKRPQDEKLRRGVDVVVACPGRLLDHVDSGTIDLRAIEVLVLDEADQMCDMGFLPDVRRIIAQLPTQRQTLFFSATMPKDIRELADRILQRPVAIEIGHSRPAATVAHALFPMRENIKGTALLQVLEREATGKVLIFTRTKRRARHLAEVLEREGHRVSALQGNMTQNRRQAAIDGFKKGRYDILVATDLAARGIDISAISHVINYDMPSTVEAYTHRIGRTGRAELTGEAFTFTTPEDEGLVRGIERVLGARIERRLLDGFDYGSTPPRPSRPKMERDGNWTPRGVSVPASARPEARSATARPARPSGGPARRLEPRPEARRDPHATGAAPKPARRTFGRPR
ncbi:MAG: DEAD/DEAH box helicase [bacterium]|nr:DEAD/DEAH box helicase [bacterium]